MVRTMKRPFTISLGFKFTVIMLIVALITSALIVFSSQQIYNNQIVERYSTQGDNLSETAGKRIDWDSIASYLETGIADANYTKTLENLRLCARSGEAAYIYVIVPTGNDITFIYDTDTAETQYQLGQHETWEVEFGNYTEDAKQLKKIGPAFFDEESYGHLLSVYTPYYRSDGTFAGYLGIDYNIDAFMEEQEVFIARLTTAAVIASLVMTLLFRLLLRRLIIEPIDSMAYAANHYLIGRTESVSDSNSITDLDINTGDELQALSESLKTMERKIRGYLSSLEEANRKAATDPMTEILNRETFENRVNWILKNDTFNGYYIYMMIDLDHFKEINDTFGHDAGDKALIASSQAIKARFRSTDYIARMGGDELAVFYKGPASLDAVTRRAELLNETVRSLHIADGLVITASIGVAVFSAKSKSDYQSFYLAADKALYDAKEKGRDCHALIFRQ